jgi:O-antigen ligase
MTPQVISTSQSLIVNIVQKLFGIVLASTSDNPHLYDRYDSTVLVRMEGYQDAFAMWQAHPVLGAGLGVHLHRQSLGGKPEIFILQIHNTGLWLLAEMGLAGFLVMAVIFALLFHKVWRLARSPPGNRDAGVWFQSAVLLIMVGWAVMSLFHELMYQRVVWLLVGMALTAPVEPLRLWKRNHVGEGEGRK